jgi:CRISPR-associated RAMP protein (TIGR02581 family)
MKTFLDLANRYIIRAELIAEHSLHVGSGTEGFAADLAFITRDGVPFIPGSSLRGVLRSHVERLLGALFPPPNRRSCYLFADEDVPETVCVAGNRRSREEIESGERRLRDPGKLCPVCRLFGSTLMAGRLKITDALLEPGSSRPLVVRDGVGIDRDTGTAREKIKFNFELLDPGAKFRCELWLENAESDDFALLYIILAELSRGIDVGGKRNSGFGRLRLQSYSVQYFDFEHDAAMLRRYMVTGEMRSLTPAEFQNTLRGSFQDFLNSSR